MKTKVAVSQIFLKSFLCFLLLLTSCREALLHNLSEIQVNRLIGILNVEGIEATKELQADMKWTLNVDEKDLVRAISILDSRRLLKDNTSNVKESSSLLGSNQEKNFYFERVLASELEKTLLTFSGVFDARVHLNIKKNDILSLKQEDDVKTSASVLMVVNDIKEFNEEKIKSIISGASGIPSKDVSIVISKISIENKVNEETKEKVAYLPNDDLGEKNQIRFLNINEDYNKENIFQEVIHIIKTNMIYIYGIILGGLILMVIKFFNKYRNNKKLDLIKTISIISK